MSKRLPINNVGDAVTNVSNAVTGVGQVVANNLNEITDQVGNQVEKQWGITINLPTILIVIFTVFVTYWILSWLFGSNSQSQQVSDAIKIQPLVVQTPRIDNREVFNIKDSVSDYHQAQLSCKRYGAQLATGEQMAKAHSNGANWCHLGWLQGQQAYYPTQSEQMYEAEKWPKELREACGKVGLNGGSYPSQLKLTVNCFGVKPSVSQHSSSLTPFNTITQKWSLFS